MFFFVKLNFRPSVERIRRSAIGEIIFQNMLLNKKIRITINNSQFSTFKIDFNSYDICVLPNDTLVSCNLNSLTILDKDLNRIKNSRFNLLTGITVVTDTSELFITDHLKNCIYVMDYNINIVKTFGSLGSGTNQLNNPFNIHFHRNYLYICDGGNNRIQILNTDFEFIDTIPLDYRPYSIKVSDTKIGVCGSNGVYFYDITTLALKEKYLNIIGRLSYINSNFYVISCAPSKKGNSVFNKKKIFHLTLYLHRILL